MEKKQKSLIERLMGRLLVCMIIIVLGISCILFYFEKQATRQFYSEISVSVCHATGTSGVSDKWCDV